MSSLSLSPLLISFLTSTVPDMQLTDEDYAVIASVTKELRAYFACLEKIKSVLFLCLALFSSMSHASLPLFLWFESSSTTYISLLSSISFLYMYVCVHSFSLPRLRDGLKHILSVSHIGNGYIQAVKPWDLVKGSSEDVYVCQIICLLLSITHPSLKFPSSLSFTPFPS